MFKLAQKIRFRQYPEARSQLFGTSDFNKNGVIK